MDVSFTMLSEAQREGRDPYEWMGRVLANFAQAEQAIGSLCLKLNLPIEKGSLSSLPGLRDKLSEIDDRRCKALANRIERWNSHRPFRHLLAHATIHRLTDMNGAPIIVTRHLPRDKDDVTPDRMWSVAEQEELLRKAINDSRSIADHVQNLMNDEKLIQKLKSV